jgi:hypothetical protein
MELLFVAAHWHSLAKLRMHNDLTLDVMEAVTVALGEKLREFKDKTCSAFITRELKRESDARARRQAKKAAADKGKSTAKRPHRTAQSLHSNSTSTEPSDQLKHQLSGVAVESEDVATDASPNGNAKRLKAFNLNTYKLHALGDYTATIRRYGTTDSYSTEPVCKFKATIYDVF